MVNYDERHLQPQRAVKGVSAIAISGLWFASRKALGFFLINKIPADAFLDQPLRCLTNLWSSLAVAMSGWTCSWRGWPIESTCSRRKVNKKISVDLTLVNKGNLFI